MNASGDPQPVLIRMQGLIEKWEGVSDRRRFFLSCYRMMTANMLAAIENREFDDPVWVERLLSHFADYYFVSLEAYEREPVSACLVWQLAHNLTRSPNAAALQLLLVGVNAHINYDLVLALADMLRDDWDSFNEAQRASRYADFCRVNDVIARTIDAVQDQILEPAMPVMNWIDVLMGPVDELIISRLINGWRENVWRHTLALLAARAEAEQVRLVSAVEQEALRIGEVIALQASGPHAAGAAA